ncbi:MAG: DUF4435 domain-containing protein [Tannerellaceae bacterium]|nr:DUF4435 domain-containing protein [Tannerellaceae bacterium]
MEIILPPRLHSSGEETLSTRILVVIGANGAGKSSFGKHLLNRYGEKAIQICGFRSLFIRNNPEDLLSPPAPLRLSEYEKLVIRLQKEEFETAVEYKEQSKMSPGLIPPVTKIDIIQEIWEKIFPQNRFLRKSGFFELISSTSEGKAYTADRMSDGEKIVFYLAGAALCAPEQAMLVIEAPEVLLHESIKNSLWNEIESLRPDCTFVYLTHDISFVTTRQESQCIWIRSCNADTQLWDYEIINTRENFPEELYIDILGSRKPILFIEGNDSNSIDNRLYPLLFPDYLVKPMGGCQKVIESTKAFRQLKDFHTLDSKGIVDRDRRTEGEIKYLRDQHIYVPDVAEVENLLLLEPVIKVVASRLMKEPGTIYEQVKKNVVQLFEKDLEAQVILHARHQVAKKLERAVNRKITSVEELTEHVNGIQETVHVDEIYTKIKDSFTSYVEQSDYPSVLRVYNQKGVLPQSRLCNLLGINNKESYLNLVLSILRENGQDAITIREALRKVIGIKI